MNIQDMSIYLGSSLFNFKLDQSTLALLPDEENMILTKIGLPNQILSNYFDYSHGGILNKEDNELILGYNTHVSAWSLKINLKSYNVYLSGKGEKSDPVFWFYNSSLKQLLLSLHAYNFFVRRLILQNTLGNYHQYHEKYAILLKELIGDIDEEAVKKGVWCSLIEEMSLGVI